MTLKKPLLFSLALLGGAAAYAGSPQPTVVPTAAPAADDWKFTLAVPGWLQGAQGTVGINGLDSNVDATIKNLINKVDMIWATRAEASKGRFGVLGEFLYTSLSDSIGVGGPLQKIDVRMDQYFADFTLRWRVIEGERGFVDVLAGVRYTNIYQSLHLQTDSSGVNEASENFVDEVSDIISDRIENVISEKRFRNALADAVRSKVTGGISEGLGPNPRRRALPIGPLGGFHPLRTAAIVESIIVEEEARLRADVDALKLKGAARVAEIRSRVKDAKKRVEKRVTAALDENLNRSFSRCDDWWDPYVGLRARLYFTPKFYLGLRGDIGGFGVGSDLMWQLDGAFGYKLTEHIFAEAGYRALSFDYDKDGLTYDVINHGAQVTMGVEF